MPFHPVLLLLIGAAAWTAAVSAAPLAPPATGTPVYAAAAIVCHQIPDRSFALAAGPLAVCARCFGLYLGGVFGFALAVVLRRRMSASGSAGPFIAAAALPTILTALAEWAIGWNVGNGIRFAAALPLGAALAVVIGAAVTVDARQVR